MIKMQDDNKEYSFIIAKQWIKYSMLSRYKLTTFRE